MDYNKQTVYKASGVYKEAGGGGGGGGGEQTVTIGGVEHKVKKINNLIWLVENLKAPFNFVHDGKSNTNAYFTYNYGDGRTEYMYNLAAKQYLYNNPDLLNGFRIPTKTDLDNLIYFVDPAGYNAKPAYYLKSSQEWEYNASYYGADVVGFNFTPACYCYWNWNQTQLNYDYSKRYASFFIGDSNYGVQFTYDVRSANYNNTFGYSNTQGNVIRLCKDA